MAKHAYLAASASHRWLKCPPSAKLCAEEEDKGSPYAQQGTDAHELCQYLVEEALRRDCRDPTENLTWYDGEMQEAAEGYRDFVMEQIAEAKKLCKDPLVCIEQVLDFSKWVEHGFGTGDCVIVADDLLQIIDFKYGLGVLVEAEDNPQLKLYALGALDTFGDLYDIQRIRLSIYQPRRGNICSWETNKEYLLTWADEILAPAAKLAYAGEGEYAAGEHCVFCKVKASCRKRAEYNLELAKHELADGTERTVPFVPGETKRTVPFVPEAPTLSPEEIAEILPRIDGMISWAEDVKAYALKQALSGTKYPGFKLVEGKSNRRFTDEALAAKIALDAGYEPYEQKILGVTALQKQLGRKKFDELLGSLVTKPRGKPVLAQESDKRPPFNNAENDFEEE